MKLSQVFFLVIFSLSLTGCYFTRSNYSMPDIKAMRTNGIALRYDIRELKKLYGNPPISGKENKIFGYYNVYRTYFGFPAKPLRSEIWYLILNPTYNVNYYTGTRYEQDFEAGAPYGGAKDFLTRDPLTNIDDIKKLFKVKPDYFKERKPLKIKSDTTTKKETEKQRGIHN